MDSGDLHPNWKALATADIKWKVFVQAEDDNTRKGDEAEKQGKIQVFPALDGEGVQRFYEELLESDLDQTKKAKVRHATNASNDRGKTKDHGTRSNSDHSEKEECGAKRQCTRTICRAMKFAQDNDVTGLRNLLHGGLYVNTKDEFGWSLLMVASCAGAKEAVEVLLEARARIGVRDSMGNTALYLATTKGHKNIVEMLISASKGGASGAKQQESWSTKGMEVKEFFCEVCNRLVKEETEKQHKSSIAHQFSVGIAKQRTMYGIPPSNRGYKLLLNQGWDEEKGLGPRSQGAKFPVKTVLKRDREGFGSERKTTPRVTHFGPADTNAVRVGKPGERRERESTLSKREMERKKSQEKRKEMELRRELNDPDY